MSKWRKFRLRYFICLIAISLSYVAYLRTDFFSPIKIQAPLTESIDGPLSDLAKEALTQPYFYLGKGRQCYVFVSQDGKTVVKFFNHKYLKLPWYSLLLKNEEIKRKGRQKYYQESYSLALHGESAILHLHLGKSKIRLPQLSIQDRAHRFFTIDLNQTPFVLQSRGESFYEGLEKIGLKEGIDQFVALISHRIEKKIADADHDVEHNFGLLEGKVFHLDPGRLFFEPYLWEPDRLAHEWWSATHRFRNFLLEKHPEAVSQLDHAIEIQKKRFDHG
jgi:hypothetical protein